MKLRIVFVTLVLGFGLALVLLWTLGDQKSSAVAAPLAPESEGDWDGLSVGTPVVISSTGQYRMWYQGMGLSFVGWGFALGYAESPDGETWQKYAGNPVLEPGESGEWDSAYRGQIALIEDGDLYKMWFSGAGTSGPWQTGYATSTDGLDWEIYSSNPVLEVGAPGSWDEQEANGPTVLKDGAVYKIWYHGCNLDYSECSIGYATSGDGINWTKYAGNPVLEATPGEWDESGLGWPRVIKNGATFEMWYRSAGKTGHATSPDGIVWTKYTANPVLSGSWDGGAAGTPSLILEGDTYKMWASGGADETRGIGYFESSDGIHWTQPVSNPILLPGEVGVIIEVIFDIDRVEAHTLGETTITITVSDGAGVKATISGVTDNGGWYRSREHDQDWNPGKPDILPGDTVSATANGHTTIIKTVGEIDAQVYNDTDLVEGTIHAPWFAPDSLSVVCELWDGDGSTYIDRDLPADGGSFQCDFSGLADIVGGVGGKAGYLEPDGDMVSVSFLAPYMEVFYGTRDGVGGIYSPGHTFWLTITNSLGEIKATAQVTSTTDGGWWGHGFMPTWVGEEGRCCDWSPADPDIQPGDWVYYRSDDGYQNHVRAGTIYGTIDVKNDSVTGPIYAPWFTDTLEVWCHPQTFWPFEYRQSNAAPNGSVPYFCEWQNPTGEQDPWDIQPDDQVMVHYREPDGDQVYRMMLASEGAPPVYYNYLPSVVLNHQP
jgi:hypothetical protein